MNGINNFDKWTFTIIGLAESLTFQDFNEASRDFNVVGPRGKATLSLINRLPAKSSNIFGLFIIDERNIAENLDKFIAPLANHFLDSSNVFIIIKSP